jgi:hypothetical protein
MQAEAEDFKNRSKKRAQDFTRERKMGFKNLVYFTLNMINESTQNALERYFAMKGEDAYMTQQAFSLARQKIKWEAFRELFDYGVEVHYKNHAEEIRRWKGFRVSAIDGIKLSLPNDKPLRAFFGASGPGMVHSPTAQGSALYDVLNDFVVDARIEPMAADERALAERHLNHLQGMEGFEEWKELILFDRGYPSIELIKGLRERKIHYVMRVREKYSTEIDGLGRGDHLIELGRGEEKLQARVIKFPLKSGETETLITDIMDRAIGAKEFKELYYKRWAIETEYDVLKKKLEIENFSGRLVDNIRQDFYAAMILTNLAADFYAEAQEGVDRKQRDKKNKYRYQVNVNHEVGVLKDRLIKTLLEEDNKKRGEMFDGVIALLQKRLIPIRPNRSIPRATPRKAKFHHNHKSNC